MISDMKFNTLTRIMLWFNLIGYTLYFMAVVLNSWLMERMTIRKHSDIILEFFIFNAAVSLYLTINFLFNLKMLVRKDKSP